MFIRTQEIENEDQNPVFMDVIWEYQMIKNVKAAVNLREEILCDCASALLIKSDENEDVS